MKSFNQFTILGNLTRDIEVRYSKSGTPVCNGGIAVNEKVKKGDNWEDEVSFFDFTAFGKRGETMAQHLGKGDPVFVTGRLRQDSWDDKETRKKMSKVILLVNEFRFVGGGNKNGSTSVSSERPTNTTETRKSPIDDEDVPF